MVVDNKAVVALPWLSAVGAVAMPGLAAVRWRRLSAGAGVVPVGLIRVRGSYD